METVMSGVTADEQQVLAAIKNKLHPETSKPVLKPAGLPVGPAATQLAQDVDLAPQNPQSVEPPVEDVQPVEGQPAEGQTTEGEAAAEVAVETLPTIKVTIKDDEGKDVEQEVTLDEARAAYMRHADYTRKTQSLAKERAQIPQKLS